MAELSRPSSSSSTEEHGSGSVSSTTNPIRRAGAPAPCRAARRRLARVADGPLARLIDRVRDWRADARFGVVVLVVVAVVAGVVWYRIGIGGAERGRVGRRRAAVTTTVSTTTLDDPTPSTRAEGHRRRAIAVHVAGAVTHPGVVELGAGARVIDAVEAVGGAQADGDLDRLNLAAKLTDGERVYVAKVGAGRSGRGRRRRRGDAAAGDGTGTGGGAGARSTSTPRRRRSSRSCRASGPRTRSRSSPNGSAAAGSRRSTSSAASAASATSASPSSRRSSPCDV